MTAAALAGELGLPLFSIRLDGLITKSMGETAAKLRLVFEAIQAKRGVYLFDKFDALNGERSAKNDVEVILRSCSSLRAPRKIGFAATNGQGQRRTRHESQSALSDETGIFRDALDKEALDKRSPVEAVPCTNWELRALTGAAEGVSRVSITVRGRIERLTDMGTLPVVPTRLLAVRSCPIEAPRTPAWLN
jgi:SpoVK/Ycf46/Vps4 family AAA+-type ATPase